MKLTGLLCEVARLALVTILLTAMAAVCLAGADDCPANHPVASGGVFSKVPGQARLKVNPLADDPYAVRAGKKLFAQHCAQCHGANAEGGKKAPSLRIQQVQAASAGSIFWVITNGVVWRGMPVWSKLPEAQRWQITAFIKSLSSAKNISDRVEAANQVAH